MITCKGCGMDLGSASETEQTEVLCRYCRNESVGHEAPKRGQGFDLVTQGTCEACGEWTRTYMDGVRTGSDVGQHGYLCRECWGAAYGERDFARSWPQEV